MALGKKTLGIDIETERKMRSFTFQPGFPKRQALRKPCTSLWDSRIGMKGLTPIWAIYTVAIIFTIGMFAITSSVLLAAPKNKKAPVVVQKVKKKKMTTLARRAANKQAEAEARVTVKSVQGIISSIRGLSISIEYKKNTDVMFLLDDNIAYHRVSGIEGLEVGDRIRIDFDECAWEEVDGFKRKKKLIKTITFVSPKPKGLVSTESNAY